MLVNSEVQSINEAWDKLIGLAGVRPSSFKMGDYLSVDGIVTTSDIAFYVNPSTGNDDLNDGSITRPFKTLAKAAQEVPFVQAHNVTINMSAGTHDITDSVLISGVQISSGVSYKITGDSTYVPATLASGVQTGKFTSSSDYLLTMTGADWTASDLVGRFLRITSGSLNGEVFPIAGNTTTTIDCPRRTMTAAATATFEIVEPSTTLNFKSGGLVVTTNGPTRASLYTSGTTTGCGAIIQKFKMTAPSDSTTSSAISFGHQSNSVLHECSIRIKDCTTSGGINTLYMHGDACTIINKVYIAAKNSGAGNSVRCIYASGSSGSGRVLARDMVLDGLAGGGSVAYGLHTLQPCTATDSIIQNVTGANGYGFYSTNKDASFSGIIKNCNYGVSLTANTASFSSSGLKILTMGAVGMTVSGGNASLSFPGILTIDACTSHGIYFPAPGVKMVMGSALTVTNCGGFGICMTNPTYPKIGTYNSVRMTTATMSGNTAGDMTIDGTTPISYATLAADPDKTIVDSVLFSRISLD